MILSQRSDLDFHVSAARKRNGNIEFHVSVMFPKYGNVRFRPVLLDSKIYDQIYLLVEIIQIDLS